VEDAQRLSPLGGDDHLPEETASTVAGIGKTLYAALLPVLRERKIHAVIGGAALPNAASVALHEALGFEQLRRFARSDSSMAAGSMLRTGSSFSRRPEIRRTPR
jgi:hypothetical protein